MKYLLPVGFVATLVLKVHVLGITGAGILTLAQLLATYGSDRLAGWRDLRRDPFTTHVRDDGLVVRVPKENRP